MTNESLYSGKTTTSSPFASGLTTPNDEEPQHNLFPAEGPTPKQLDGLESQQFLQKHPRKGPLFRAVSKAREAAKSVFETPKRLKKVWKLQLFPPLFLTPVQRQSVVTQEGPANQAEFKDTPGTPSDTVC